MSGMDKHVPSLRDGGLYKKAYKTYYSQLNKCNNPVSHDYKYYGGKGIRVEYSREDFIKWYLESAKGIEDMNLTVGRIDHEKNYAFGNIMLESFRSNRSERWQRKGRIGKKDKKIGLFTKSGECFAEFESINKCALYFNMDPSGLYRTSMKGNPRGSTRFSWLFKLI